MMDKGIQEIMNRAVNYPRHKRMIEELQAENKKLREALEKIARNKYNVRRSVIVAKDALMQSPDVPQQTEKDLK